MPTIYDNINEKLSIGLNKTQPITILFSAGDPSGDQHTAPVIRLLYKKLLSVECIGIGGALMEKEGFKAVLPFKQFNCMGYIEVLTKIPFMFYAQKKMINIMKRRKPALLVCVDYSGFNFPLAKVAHRLEIPVLWYISPKFWAWKHDKYVNNLKRYVTKIASIFPFETNDYKKNAQNMQFVGNPLVEYMKQNGYFPRSSENSTINKIAIVPGSRISEVIKMLPVMLDAFSLVKKKYPNIEAVVSTCDHIDPSLYDAINGIDGVDVFSGTLEELFSNTDITIISSGTATLQAALMGIPMVVCYKMAPLTYWIGRRLITGISHIALPNIIAQKLIVPECIQDQMNPQIIAKFCEEFITDKKKYIDTINNLSMLHQELGSLKPSEILVNIICQLSGVFV